MKLFLGVILAGLTLVNLVSCSTWQRERQAGPRNWADERDHFLVDADNRFNILAHEETQLKNLSRGLRGEEKIETITVLDDLAHKLQKVKSEIDDVRYTNAADFYKERDQAAEKLNELETSYLDARTAQQ